MPREVFCPSFQGISEPSLGYCFSGQQKLYFRNRTEFSGVSKREEKPTTGLVPIPEGPGVGLFA